MLFFLSGKVWLEDDYKLSFCLLNLARLRGCQANNVAEGTLPVAGPGL